MNISCNDLLTINIIRKNYSAKYIYLVIVGSTNNCIIKNLPFWSKFCL